MSKKSNIEDLYPLSSLQQGLLFHSLYAPGSGAYIEQLVYPLEASREDLDLLAEAFQRLVNLHPILRTAFVWERRDEPLQVVVRKARVPRETLDWRDLSAEAVDARLAALLEEDRRRGFDLSRPLLLRIAFVLLPDARSLLVLTYHHILLDGWSVSLVLEDLFTLYRALRSGVEPDLEARPPFRAYIDWLAGQDLAAAEPFWRRTLAGFTAPTPLPVVFRPAGGPIEPAQVEQVIPEELSGKLRSFAQKNRLTLKTVLQAAWAFLLSRSGGGDDVLFGATFLGRPDELPGVHRMIGLLVNTLPVRIRVPSSGMVLDWLTRLQTEAFELRRFELTPLAEIQKWSEVPRGTPLFESILDFTVASATERRDRSAMAPSLVEATHFPLTVDIADRGDLTLCVAFDRARLDRIDVLRLAHHFMGLLEGFAAAGAGTRLAELSLLSTSARHQVTSEWNDSLLAVDRETALPYRFEQQAAQTPDRIALVGDGESLTYGETSRRAGRLARRLRTAGAGPGVTVGLCTGRSLDMVIALLAILKAGSAYLPLDPDLPAERLALMLEDSQVRVLLLDERLAGRLPSGVARVVGLSTDSAMEEEPGPEPWISAMSPAYVLYTSGSTGRPKGVQISHGALMNFLDSMRVRPGIGPEDRLAAVTTLSFDIAGLEIYLPLLAGATVIVVPRDVAGDGERLGTLLADTGATILQATPATWRLLIAAGWQGGSGFKALCGGEALPWPLAAQLLAACGEVWNMYGPTETTIWSGIERVGPAGETGCVSIGRPIANTRLLVLDPCFEPAAPGVAGELFIGGSGLAQGYVGRPDLTAERFVPDPFGLAPGDRLYRTGDLVRTSGDGRLEYLGRTDHQVKLRGFRIELGEIEAALVRHPAVAEAVVTVREDPRGDRQLVAYLVLRGPEAPSTDALRQTLGRTLPEPMIPAAFVVLEALPLTANGKVDRKALPAPGGERPHLDQDFVPPRTDLERRLAGIWSDVLSLDRVGIHDSFFALGGDSILGIRVLAQARREGLQVTLPQLMRFATIERLAQELGAEGGAGEESAPVAPFALISTEERAGLPASVEDAYPVTMLQAGMLFHGELVEGAGVYHDVFSYHLVLELDAQRLREAARRVAARHPILRTSFDLAGLSRPLQHVSREVEIPILEEDLSHLSEEEQERRIDGALEAERRRPFDWSRPPLLRFLVHRRGPAACQLSVSFHHAILDGWSLASLLSELLQEHTALLGGRSLEIPPPPVAFREAVALELTALASSEARSYWRARLADAPQLALPRWPLPPSQQEASSHLLEIPSGHLERLEQVARRAGVPLKSVVLAAHARVLALWGGQTDVVTGLVSSGRPELEGGERVLGLFLNTLPLRLELGGGSWLDLIRSAFTAENEALPYRRYPLAQIQRDTGDAPLFETTLSFVHFHVYEESVSSQLRLLGRKSFERNNFTLAADFWVEPGGRTAFLRLDSDPAALGAAQVASIAGTYGQVLEAIARDPHGRYDAVDLHGEAGGHEVLRGVDVTRTMVDRPSVHQGIAVQAGQAPAAPAVVCGSEMLSYGELDRWANRLAWRLADAGVAPGSLVGVRLERSVRMVAALLGVLKTGAAYVPLDPSYPAERLAVIREDARLSLELTDDRLEELLAGSDPREDVPPMRSTPPEALAYVMFTSGSTGRPKGVQVSHGALANFLESMEERPGIAPGDRLAAVTTLSFDIAGLELYLPLIAGACVIVVPREVAADGERLRDLLQESRATMLQATPATWHLLLEAGWTGGAGFRALCGGEALAPQLAYRLLAACGEVWNLYGPTETTIWSSVERVAPGWDRGAVPLGRPIANTELYVLDRFLAPAPPLTPGELYIGGLGLAWGYLHRPELTAERFLPDPFSGRAGARLYRTGDLVRTLLDGRLEYLGRMDHQVKLRGFRIELGEIEAAVGGPLRWRGPWRRCVKTGPETENWWPTSCRGRRRISIRPLCEPTPASGCPSTWSPRPGWCSPSCRSPPTARLTGGPCPSPDARRPEQARGRPRPATRSRRSWPRCGPRPSAASE